MTQEEKDLEIKKMLEGKTIQHPVYYLMNRPGYFYPDMPEQLVDSGVEIGFDDGSFFSMGMNFKYVAIDFFHEKFEDVINNYNGQIPFLKLEVPADKKWEPIIGKKIKTATVTWNWFEDLDEVKHFIPQDIEMELEDGLYLALCTTAYTLDEDGISILGPDSEGEILVLFSEEDTKYFKRGKYYEPDAFPEGDVEEKPMFEPED